MLFLLCILLYIEFIFYYPPILFMKLLLMLFLALLPSFIGVPLRRLLGQKIGQGTKISFGTIIITNNIYY